MKNHKIVFTGAPGAGKTTAITALSDIAPVLTEVHNTDAHLGKAQTTVGLDFGQVNLDSGQCIRLFGTPGQLRFEFMWKIIATDALGLVILVNNASADPLADFIVYLDAYRDLLPTMNCVVGIGRTVECPLPTADQYAEVLATRGLVFPVLQVDVRSREDLLMLLEAVLFQAEVRN